MTELMIRPGSEDPDPDGVFSVRTRLDHPRQVVALSGELDLASRDEALGAFATVGLRHVLADLSDLVFMDCAGYRALVRATAILERRGGSLVLMNAVGEPRRLLLLLDAHGLGLCAPLRYGTLSDAPAAGPGGSDPVGWNEVPR